MTATWESSINIRTSKMLRKIRQNIRHRVTDAGGIIKEPVWTTPYEEGRPDLQAALLDTLSDGEESALECHRRASLLNNDAVDEAEAGSQPARLM